jgi:hypothetical protein
MPDNALFNVLVVAGDPSAFSHTATAANVDNNWTELDHPRLNDDPDAIFLVTQTLANGVPNDQELGVWFQPVDLVWVVFNQDLVTPVPLNATFNILVITGLENSWIHTSAADNIYMYCTLLLELPFDDKSNNGHVFLQTQNASPGGASPAVWYDHHMAPGREGYWGICREDPGPMEEGPAYNVMIAPVFIDGFDTGDTSSWTVTVP